MWFMGAKINRKAFYGQKNPVPSVPEKHRLRPYFASYYFFINQYRQKIHFLTKFKLTRKEQQNIPLFSWFLKILVGFKFSSF